MARPTHFYRNATGYLRFVTLKYKGKKLLTSDGMDAESVDVRPVSDLYGRVVGLDGGKMRAGKIIATTFENFKFLGVEVRGEIFEGVNFIRCFMRQFNLISNNTMFRCKFENTDMVNCELDGGYFEICDGFFKSDIMYSTGRPVYAVMVDGEVRVKDGGFYGTLGELRVRVENTNDCLFHRQLCDEIIPKYFNLK